MPTTFWTQAEHDAAMDEVKSNAMALAQALCAATGGQCICGAGGVGRGPGEYCDICVAEPHCPNPFKEYSQ